VIVSKGPRHEEIQLAVNMWGAEFLPQTSILPLIDLVITHGGEQHRHGKPLLREPMIVLPLFWDQPDNAQRVRESGLGVRLDPYRCAEGELLGSVKSLLADDALHSRLRALSARLQARPGTHQAAALIDQLARSQPSSGVLQ